MGGNRIREDNRGIPSKNTLNIVTGVYMMKEHFEGTTRKYHSFYKYIVKRKNGSYRIKKDDEWYGTYEDVRDALHDRDLLIESDWDIAEVMAQDEKPNKYKDMELPEWNRKPRIYDDRYITTQKSGNKTYYKIQKHIDGVQQSFGYYNTYEEAINKRDELEALGWVK